MSDLISRQAAIDALMNDVTPYGLMDNDGNIEAGCKDKDVIAMLYNLPSAQPEIIRCKECEYWDVSWQNDDEPDCHYCPLADRMRRGDFYCADAERKGEKYEID